MSGNPLGFGSFKYDVIVEKDVIINSRNGITERWEVQNSLGSGTFGAVSRHSLVDSVRRSYRAVKEICLRLGVTVNNKTIARELKAMIALREHTDLFVTLLVGMRGITLSVSPWNTLKEVISGPISEETRIALRNTAAYFCHRDLKPENILIASRYPPKVKLADFGVSTSTDASASIMQTEAGTPKYMAPEVLGYNDDTTEYTNAVDIWAMGAIAHEIFTGIAPFCICPDDRTTTCTTIHHNPEIHLKAQPSRNMLSRLFHNQTPFPDVHLINCSAPCDLVDFIKKTMQFLPDARPSASEALEHTWINPREPTGNGVVTEKGCVAAVGREDVATKQHYVTAIEPIELVAERHYVPTPLKGRPVKLKVRIKPTELAAKPREAPPERRSTKLQLMTAPGRPPIKPQVPVVLEWRRIKSHLQSAPKRPPIKPQVPIETIEFVAELRDVPLEVRSTRTRPEVSELREPKVELRDAQPEMRRVRSKPTLGLSRPPRRPR